VPQTDRFVRAVAVSTFANAVGSGPYLPISVLFFASSVSLNPVEVGLGLSAAGGLAARR
jgi:hypothetical protein